MKERIQYPDRIKHAVQAIKFTRQLLSTVEILEQGDKHPTFCVKGKDTVIDEDVKKIWTSFAFGKYLQLKEEGLTKLIK